MDFQPTPGAEAIARERTRQLEEEGFRSDHDDLWTDGELARAAFCYVQASIDQRLATSSTPPPGWPTAWDERWWKPSTDPRRNVAKAGALLAAEHDRLERAGVRPCPKCDGCGRVASDEEQTPWTFWEQLPPGSDLAVRTGMVRPETCPACDGSGRRAAPPAAVDAEEPF